jgi:hypothetical protein
MHAVPFLSKRHLRYHHQQREPYGIDQFYQHPVDNLMIFILPGLLAAGILPISLDLFAWVLALAVLGNMLSHGPFGGSIAAITWTTRSRWAGECGSIGRSARRTTPSRRSYASGPSSSRSTWRSSIGAGHC